MTIDAHKNFAYSTVATVPVPGDTGLTLSVQAGEGARFPTPPFNFTVCPAGQQPLPSNAEIARCTSLVGDVLTIARAKESTNARVIVAGDQIFAGPTAKALTDIEQRLDVVGNAASAALLQQGVLLSTDAPLTINSTSSVTLGSAPRAWIADDTGLLTPTPIVGQTFAGISAAATYTRLDQIVTDWSGGTGRFPGVETNGATLANRNGAAVLPAGVRVLYDILVTTGGVLAANVRDRRPWARGAYSLQTRTAGTLTSPASVAAIDATNLQARLECSGVPVRVTLAATIDAPIGSSLLFALYLDGAPVVGEQDYFAVGGSAVGAYFPTTITWEFTPSAGSHLFTPEWWFTGANSGLFVATSTNTPRFKVEEIVRQNANNGTS